MMEITFNRITEAEFSESKYSVLFNDNLHSRCFGVITNGFRGFKFGWRSDLLEPTIFAIDKNIYTVGIDQNFAIIDFDKGRILLALSLTYNFVTTIPFMDNIFVCTELEIIKIAKDDVKVLSSYPLHNFFEELILSDDGIKVKCFKEEVITLM